MSVDPKHAKDLLRGDSVSVGEVAQRLGYSSSSTFSVAFARQVGTSPAGLRARIVAKRSGRLAMAQDTTVRIWSGRRAQTDISSR